MALDSDFIASIEKLAAEQGRDALLDPRRRGALLADYTRGEYQKERRRLEQALNDGYGQTIAEAADLAAAAASVIRRMREEDGLSEEAARDVADLLAWVLRGERVAVQPEPAEIEQSAEKTTNQPSTKVTPESDFVTSLNADGSVTIIDYEGYDKDIVIPARIGGRAVKSIGENALSNMGFKSVVIPVGVTSIGWRAFANNQLTSVAIPTGVTEIMNMAFANNELASVTIPAGVTKFGGYVFGHREDMWLARRKGTFRWSPGSNSWERV